MRSFAATGAALLTSRASLRLHGGPPACTAASARLGMLAQRALCHSNSAHAFCAFRLGARCLLLLSPSFCAPLLCTTFAASMCSSRAACAHPATASPPLSRPCCRCPTDGAAAPTRLAPADAAPQMELLATWRPRLDRVLSPAMRTRVTRLLQLTEEILRLPVMQVRSSDSRSCRRGICGGRLHGAPALHCASACPGKINK